MVDTPSSSERVIPSDVDTFSESMEKDIRDITQFLSLPRTRQLLDCSFHQLRSWRGTLLVTINESEPYSLRWTTIPDPQPYEGYGSLWITANGNNYWLRIKPGETHVCGLSCRWFMQISHIVNDPLFKSGLMSITFEKEDKITKNIPKTYAKEYYIYKQ